MVVSRCRGIFPLSGIVFGTVFLLAADLRRHPTLAALGLHRACVNRVAQNTISGYPNWSESGVESLRGAPLDMSRCMRGE